MSISVKSKIEATEHIEKIVFGAGCFWGVEKEYASIDGVINAVSGYSDGQGVEPTYKAITEPRNNNNPNNHAEVVEVTFSTNEISTEELIRHFFEGHDPTQLNRQGNDIGTQYRSGVYCTNTEQMSYAKKTRASYQKCLFDAGFNEITTEIKRLESFYFAEEYHQEYLAKNPNGYCGLGGTGVSLKKSS